MCLAFSTRDSLTRLTRKQHTHASERKSGQTACKAMSGLELHEISQHSGMWLANPTLSLGGFVFDDLQRVLTRRIRQIEVRAGGFTHQQFHMPAKLES